MNFEHLVTSVVLDVPLLYHRFLTKDSFISVSKERGKEKEWRYDKSILSCLNIG